MIRFIVSSLFGNRESTAQSMRPQKILSKKYVRGKPYYKVKWEGMDKEQATWQSPPALFKYKSLINKYEVKNWGMALDEKFFDPANYLNKGFAKSRGEKKEAKQLKRSRKYTEKNYERHSQKRQDSKKKIVKNSSSEGDSDNSEQLRKSKNKPRQSKQKPELSRSDTQSSSNGQPSSERECKNKKNCAPAPICIIDSESNNDESAFLSEKGMKNKNKRYKYAGSGEILELLSSENPPIQDLHIQNSPNQRIAIPPPSEVESKETENKRQLAPNQTLDAEALNRRISVVGPENLTPQQQVVLPKQTLKKNYQLQLISGQGPQQVLNASTQKDKKKVLTLEKSDVLNINVPPKSSCPVILKIFHLQKLPNDNRSYLVEYSDGMIIKLSTAQLMQNHPNQFVCYLERAMMGKNLSSL